MKLTYEELAQISDFVSDLKGWDFSPLREERAPVPWNYLNVVCQFLNQTDDVLDIGTGGGKKFLSLASYLRKGIGIDINSQMIEQAEWNKTNQRVVNIDFFVMDGHRLGFPEACFDMILNRHCDVNVRETTRVLRDNGYFVTQQVAERNTLNILEAFGWTPASFGDNWWQPLERLAIEFEQTGCRVVAKAEYDVRYWFCDLQSLMFWLKAVPLPEPFDIKKHWQGVNRIIEEYSTPRGIETNEHRELLIIRKG